MTEAEARAIIFNWCGSSENLFTRRLGEFLTVQQIAQVVQVLQTTCSDCYEQPAGCQCCASVEQ
jgi:hypothetical protein